MSTCLNDAVNSTGSSVGESSVLLMADVTLGLVIDMWVGFNYSSAVGISGFCLNVDCEDDEKDYTLEKLHFF